MKLMSLAALLILLSGCGPYKVTVYGPKATPYTAPDLCAAVLACQNAGEASCYYVDSTETVTTPEGTQVTTTTCKKAK